MTSVSEEKKAEYGAMFSALDKDGSGTVSVRELRDAMGRLGLDESKAAGTLAGADLDGDGVVDLGEFVALLHGLDQGEAKKAELQAIFDEFDADGDGFISRAEYQQVVSRLGEDITDEQVSELFALTDSDDDKLITFDEFRASFG
ncbi:EF-hand domain-containing protein [Amycolatopsis sp. NPDC059657]|uniref:EF-hand domain-containing protein n=1 Tax=Amycolatopsis sp. NPDC059657 TaxID=3346899 RepID=UPI00366EF7F0